jgi:uncharacterized membrane protein SpoIIM required for sporulation
MFLASMSGFCQTKQGICQKIRMNLLIIAILSLLLLVVTGVLCVFTMFNNGFILSEL